MYACHERRLATPAGDCTETDAQWLRGDTGI
jgi:hypothetical protein